MKKAIITEKDIMELLNSYDNNNANQVYTSGGLEYSLFEMVSKKFMRTQYTPEWKKAMDEGYVYAHDSAQELFKGINCLSGANNIIVKDSNGNVFPTNLEYFVNELFGTEDFYVPTVNIKTGYTEWKKVLNAFCTGFDDIYRLKFTKGLTIECTSDHKFLRANLKHKPYNCKKDSYRSFDDGLDNENILNLYKIDYKNINDYYQSALFGFFLGDGTLNKKALTFRFAFKKEDKAEYLEFLCNKLNLKFNKTYQKNGYIYYSFPDYKIDKYYSKSELINKYKNNLHMKGLLEGLINSDGSIQLDENNVVRCDFISTNKDIYDLYITACFVNGLKHSYHKRNNGGNRKDSYYTTVAGCKDFLSSINLRNSFSRKICTAIESNKKYNDNNYIKLKDSEYIGYGRVYNLSIEDNHNFMAGIGGFVLVKNCFTVDARQVIRKGLRTYGDNNIGVASAPPKHFSTALELIEQTMGLAVVYCAGGIAAACLNTFLAPFMVDESDEDIKQALQSLLFQMNQSFKNRGSQSMFSSVNVDLEMPEWLKKETAYGPGGEPCGVYGDYQDEAKRFVHLLTEVSIEGDAEDKPLFMPNLIYNIDGADLNEWLDVFELSAKFSSPYFCHYHKNNVEYQTTLGCLDRDEGIWVKLDGNVEYKTFFELSKLLNADYGLTPVNMDLKVLTIDNNKSVHWRQVKNFIWNKNKELYKVSLSDGKSFVCDDQHELLTVKGINPINIFDCTKGSNILGLNYRRNNINFNIDYMAALYGFYLGDGDKHNNYGCIAVTKDDKKDYLENLFNKLDINYNYKFKEYPQDERHPNSYMHKFYFPKHIIDNYKPDLTDNNVLAGILSGMLSSDGYVRFNKGGFNVTSLAAEFVSTNFEYIKLFEYCCFNLGLKFRTSLKQGAKDNHSDFKRVYISCNNNTVHVLKQLFLRNKQAKLIESVNIGDYRDMNNYKSIRVKSIEKVGFGDSFCIEVNGRMIFGEDFILSAQCRSALPANWTEDPNIDCMGLGNSVYTTVSLPAIALKTVEEDGNFYDNLKYYMGLVREYNLNRLDWIKKLWYEYHTADFMIQEMPGGRPLYDLDNATIVLGYLGLSEALEILGYGDITEASTEQSRFIMCFMADEIAKWKEEDGLRWGLFQTPAENLAYKNAQKMVRKYGFKRSHAKGTATRPFYTNSNHVPVDSDINLIDRIRIEGNNQPFGPAGNIMNVYLGESYSEASALKSLCEKIRDNTDAYFWAFSSAYSICPECNSKFKGAITKCPFDSAETDVYDRVTGYLTNTKTWNPGKREEFKRRNRY